MEIIGYRKSANILSEMIIFVVCVCVNGVEYISQRALSKPFPEGIFFLKPSNSAY